MFIPTEGTPNPNALKFLPGVDIAPEQPVYFSSHDQASGKSGLATKLLAVDGVGAVFFGSNFITVTKIDQAKWPALQLEILMIISDHLISNHPVFDQPASQISSTSPSELSDIERQIIEIIETRVRPFVAMDGGDIIYKGFDGGVVKLELRGACAGCPSSSITLKTGIESMLKRFVPEVESVEAVESNGEY